MGRNYVDYGLIFDVVKVMGNLDIVYLVRGIIINFKEINIIKRYIKKVLEK